VVDATWRAATRIKAGVGDLVQRIRDDRVQVGYSVAGRSGGTVCDLHHTHGGDKKHGFPSLTSKLMATVC
jgi:hypothetical protein